jgi:hypothetical protein
MKGTENKPERPDRVQNKLLVVIEVQVIPNSVR